MIKDRKPYFIRIFIEIFYKFWTNYFVIPQFKSAGTNIDINKPWNLDIYGDNICIGNNVHFRTSRNIITQICSWNKNNANAKISIGDNVLISPGVRIIAAKEIIIEKNVMIASNVYISDADWHCVYDRLETPGKTKRILIKENAWIGEGSKISKGVTIGNNSIIGIGSVVVSDVADNKIFAYLIFVTKFLTYNLSYKIIANAKKSQDCIKKFTLKKNKHRKYKSWNCGKRWIKGQN